jgi:hypothetical protein
MTSDSSSELKPRPWTPEGALRHIVEEISGQIDVGTLSQLSFERKQYWRQIVGVAQEALHFAEQQPVERVHNSKSDEQLVDEFENACSAYWHMGWKANEEIRDKARATLLARLREQRGPSLEEMMEAVDNAVYWPDVNSGSAVRDAIRGELATLLDTRSADRGVAQ